MSVFFEVAAANLLSAPVLFFLLGLTATLAGAQFSLPEGAAKMLALYLMLAIGFKGGAALSTEGAGTDLAVLLLAGITLSALMPLLGERLLRRLTRLDPIERSAVAAHYGSISLVTFLAATTTLSALGLKHDSGMVAVAAIMEAPAILTAMILIGRARAKAALPRPARARSATFAAVTSEVLLNQTIVILLGAFAIGAVTGAPGLKSLEPFVVMPFAGVLCLFLLDLGAQAGRGLKSGWRDMTPGCLSFGIIMPVAGASIAAGMSMAMGLTAGNAALLITLAASASYIAVPAAMRLAVPEARPSISLGLALGVTFPANILFGIPLYILLARMLAPA